MRGSEPHNVVDEITCILGRKVTISLITLLWRNEQYANAFARSLLQSLKQYEDVVELVVVVNGPDGLAAESSLREVLASSASVRMKVVFIDHNLGFAGGVNRGCDEASGEVFVIANLDLELDPDFVAAVSRVATALVAPMLVAPSVHDFAQSPACSRGDLGALRRDFLHRPRILSPTPDGPAMIPAGNGCCLIFGRALLERRKAELGEFLPEAFHSYYEDVELFWWANRSKVPVWFHPEVRVRHHQGGSFNGLVRFRDRSEDLQTSIMANYRLMVWQHSVGIRDVAGWLLGEMGYVGLTFRAHGMSGLVLYASSWPLALSRATRLRMVRGGRLRSKARTGD